MKQPSVEVKVVCNQDEHLPQYASDGAAGADLKACIPSELVLQPGTTALVPTGLQVELPPGYELQVRPRSGLALKHGITVLNTPGTVDADYRGHVGVILINHGTKPFVIEPGMRIAQAVIAPVTRARFVRVSEELQASTRGSGGFGHTGFH